MAITYLYYSWVNLKGKHQVSKFKTLSSISNHNHNDKDKLKDENFIDFVKLNFPDLFGKSSKKEILSLIFQIKSGFNSVMTTSMGRLFDAISAVMGITGIASFEGEAAINLEMTIKNSFKDAYEYKYIKNSGSKIGDECFIIDDIDLFARIINDILRGKKYDYVSARFHNTLASIILDISLKTREKLSINTIALSGGVFQNNYLIDKTFKMLQNNDFKVFTNYKVPVNDGGISLGQAYLGLKSIKVF